jgi:hypothetical protein
MKLRIIAAAVLAGYGLLPGSAAASVPGEVSVGCKAVGVALTALAGYTAGAPFGPAATSVTLAVTNAFGSSALAASCENYYVALEKQKNTFDYAGFVDTVCGGNPLACPNGLNAMGQLPGSPGKCNYYITCSVPHAVRSNASLTARDLIGAGTFLELSRSAGYWDYHRYGYLVDVWNTGTIGDSQDLH